MVFKVSNSELQHLRVSFIFLFYFFLVLADNSRYFPGMVDEALAILAILATHQDGRSAIGHASAVPELIDLIKSGSARNKENAAAVTLALATYDPVHLDTALQMGAQGPLHALVIDGTVRAKRKATLLLGHMRKQQEPCLPSSPERCV